MKGGLQMLRQALVGLLLTVSVWAQGARHFTFHYGFTVKDVPAGQKVRVWIPSAHSDDFQEVKIISALGDLSLKKNQESKYGNEMYYGEEGKASKADFHFEILYDVVRHERVVLGRSIPRLSDFTLDKKIAKRDTAADTRVPVTGTPAEVAVKVAAKKTPLEKARAIYDYVLEDMTYDEPGHGDALNALQTKKGDCTDFNSLLISMARSQGIPARFAIGFSLPADKTSAEISEYHCWAEFFEPQHGWVPLDLVEGLRQEVKRDYFFGALDDNRVEFSMGRDLKLNPAQDGEALNYFVYPYVEVGGKKYENVELVFSFADVSGAN